MKQALQLKIGQQLTMTPQLQQAIRLLQLSTLDLQQEIQQALESNPMLERLDDSESSSDDPPLDKNAASNAPEPSRDDSHSPQDLDAKPHSENNHSSSDEREDKSLESSSTLSNEGEAWETSIPDELPVDTRWEDVYQSSYSSSTAEKDDSYFDFHLNHESSLTEHLLWQLNVTPMSDSDRAIAHAIIDSVEPSGLLSSSLEDIYDGLMDKQESDISPDDASDTTEEEREPLEEHELQEEDNLPSFEDVKAVQKRLQLFDPVGVCSQDLSECLTVQLNQCPPETLGLANAIKIVSSYLPLLASRDYKQLMRLCRIKEPELKVTVDLIQTLTPHPGSTIGHNETRYIVPDVFVKKHEEHWVVELNPDIAPQLRINNHYANLVKRADSSSDNTYLKDNLQEARWFLKSLQSRNDTLLKVASCIVEKQQGFLDCGPESMRPMVLHDIAEEVGMHESTISRVTTQKYMHTPQGIFELKYFFSSHVSTEGGGECSSTAIRAIIKKLVAAENPRKPLSDNKITHLLADQGIKVARRTIAKYRESLGISASNERKRLV